MTIFSDLGVPEIQPSWFSCLFSKHFILFYLISVAVLKHHAKEREASERKFILVLNCRQSHSDGRLGIRQLEQEAEVTSSPAHRKQREGAGSKVRT